MYHDHNSFEADFTKVLFYRDKLIFIDNSTTIFLELFRSIRLHFKTIADLYCFCTNTDDCGATFVMTLAFKFKHYLNPPSTSTAQLAQNILNNLTKTEQASLLQDL